MLHLRGRRNSIIAFPVCVAACLMLAACTHRELADGRLVSISFSETRLKTTLASGRTSLCWSEGDEISVYNDFDSGIASAAYSKGATIKVSIPASADSVKATYPCTCGTFSEPGFVFPDSQVQSAPGVLNGVNYPLVAKARIENDAAELHFTSVGSAFALNVFNPVVSGEKLQKVYVKPSQRPAAVGVSLSAPFEIGVPAPADKRLYENQVYACLEKGLYNKIEFTVRTDRAQYKIISNETFMDLATHDFFAVNIDMANLKVYAGASNEGFGYEMQDVTLPSSGFVELVEDLPEDQLTEDIIPDFSTVGYCHSDAAYPGYPVVETITPEYVVKALSASQYADTTSLIQAAIDRAASTPGGGAVLLKNGVYNVGGVLFLDKDKVILKGESREGTVIRLLGTLQKPGIVVGTTIPFQGTPTEEVRSFSGRKFELSKLAVDSPEGREQYGDYYLYQWLPSVDNAKVFSEVAVIEDYCPVGRYSVTVENPSAFSVGSDVVIGRPHSNIWISDIGMDRIASNGREFRPVVQWNKRNMSMQWTRKITAIEGNRVRFDAPLVQSLDARYGGGSVALYTLDRKKGCGVENLTLDSDYDPSVKTAKGECMDENHAWYGLVFTSAEDCYAYNVTVKHVGYSAVLLMSGVRCVTIDDCSYVEPVSYPSTARRYGFCISGADLCLFKNCYCERAAIGFATNAKGGGPNVYHNCTGANMRTGAGPHQSWSTGTLYDCCSNSAGFRCTDHGNSGTGHGWCGANNVFWNITTAGEIECESPWAKENTPEMDFNSPYASGRNYCIGAVGGTRVKYALNRDYYGKPVADYFESQGYTHRPDAQWYPYVGYGEGGASHVSLPCAEAQGRFSWWPVFSKTSFSNPLSLYECQLEERRSSN